jgi:hypothetical protein
MRLDTHFPIYLGGAGIKAITVTIQQDIDSVSKADRRIKPSIFSIN